MTLSTGRCRSVTFAKACGHLANFSSGHETLAAEIGPRRFSYPDDHIEADNRLSWFLGGLGRTFATSDTLYVHLTRDPDQVARSFLARWDSPYEASMIRAFASGIVMRTGWSESERLAACRFYVDTVTANIGEFVAAQPRKLHVRLEDAAETFPVVLDRIGATGDLEAAAAEWSVKHNASRDT